MKTMHPDQITPTAARMVAYLLEHGPTTALAIGAAFSKLPTVATQHLRIARNCGLAVVSGQGRAPLWYLPEHAAMAGEMLLERAALARARRKAVLRQQDRKRKAAWRAKRDAAPLPVVKRTVRAVEAPRNVALGPRSVFELGAML